MADDVMRFLALWQLVHETADEGLKAAIRRGAEAGVEEMDKGPDAFVDGLAAMVEEEKERLKSALAGDGPVVETVPDPVRESLEELRFEVGELRGRLASIETSLDTVLRKLDGKV